MKICFLGLTGSSVTRGRGEDHLSHWPVGTANHNIFTPPCPMSRPWPFLELLFLPPVIAPRGVHSIHSGPIRTFHGHCDNGNPERLCLFSGMVGDLGPGRQVLLEIIFPTSQGEELPRRKAELRAGKRMTEPCLHRAHYVCT